jgi:hypothetical protein
LIDGIRHKRIGHREDDRCIVVGAGFVLEIGYVEAFNGQNV